MRSIILCIQLIATSWCPGVFAAEAIYKVERDLDVAAFKSLLNFSPRKIDIQGDHMILVTDEQPYARRIPAGTRYKLEVYDYFHAYETGGTCYLRTPDVWIETSLFLDLFEVEQKVCVMDGLDGYKFRPGQAAGVKLKLMDTGSTAPGEIYLELFYGSIGDHPNKYDIRMPRDSVYENVFSISVEE
jgi:hypothetical protein